MKRLATAMIAAGLLGGCAVAPSQTVRYQNGQVHYVESKRPDASVRGVGGVTSVTFEPNYVRFETAQGNYVIPREHFVDAVSLPLVP